MIQAPKNLEEFSALLDVVKALRSENGCPWDKEQTHQSLATYAIEEAHELAEAIEIQDREEMVSELGDLLLQVALHSEIGRATANEEMKFTIADVIRAINEKMVRRHPHVFALEKAKDTDEVLKNWAEIKRQEKLKAGAKKTENFDIPINIPALMRAQKIGIKTKDAHFDWQTPHQVIEKLEEEISELKQALFEVEKSTTSKPELQNSLESELGDVLFCCAQLARHLKFDAEQALRIANQRFEKRFFKMFEIARSRPELPPQPNPEQLEQLWSEVKRLEKAGNL